MVWQNGRQKADEGDSFASVAVYDPWIFFLHESTVVRASFFWHETHGSAASYGKSVRYRKAGII